jgi:hypothetical protein
VQRGDVLWRSGHTELYLGSGIEGGARRSETGGKDGRTGDQDGGEITRSTYIQTHWTSAYRCNKTRPGEGTPTSDETEVTPMGGAILYDGGDGHVYYWDGSPECVPYHVSGAEKDALVKLGFKLQKLDRTTADTIMSMCKARKGWREEGIALACARSDAL